MPWYIILPGITLLLTVYNLSQGYRGLIIQFCEVRALILHPLAQKVMECTTLEDEGEVRRKIRDVISLFFVLGIAYFLLLTEKASY